MFGWVCFFGGLEGRWRWWGGGVFKRGVAVTRDYFSWSCEGGEEGAWSSGLGRKGYGEGERKMVSGVECDDVVVMEAMMQFLCRTSFHGIVRFKGGVVDL